VREERKKRKRGGESVREENQEGERNKIMKQGERE